MMENITEGWNKLSFSDNEGGGFRLHNDLGSNEFILATKFYTKQILTFTQLWQSRNVLRLRMQVIMLYPLCF